MKKTYYEKRGRRYVPVSEYDRDFVDSLPKGHSLVSVWPGRRSIRYEIDPAFGPMIAAGLYASSAITGAIVKASELRPKNKPLTPKQLKAWRALEESFAHEVQYLVWPSPAEVAEAGVDAMMQEAEKMLTNPAVRAAWDHFMLVAKLSQETQT